MIRLIADIKNKLLDVSLLIVFQAVALVGVAMMVQYDLFMMRARHPEMAMPYPAIFGLVAVAGVTALGSLAGDRYGSGFIRGRDALTLATIAAAAAGAVLWLPANPFVWICAGLLAVQYGIAKITDRAIRLKPRKAAHVDETPTSG